MKKRIIAVAIVMLFISSAGCGTENDNTARQPQAQSGETNKQDVHALGEPPIQPHGTVFTDDEDTLEAAITESKLADEDRSDLESAGTGHLSSKESELRAHRLQP